jgi:hypothetical protein
MKEIMNKKHLVESFIEFEQNNQLFDLEIGGVAIWHPIRFMVYNEILKSHLNIGKAHASLVNENILKRIGLKAKQLPHMITKNPYLHLSQKDVLIFNHHRRVKNGAYYTCLYTDMLLEELTRSNLVVEEPILDEHRKPIKNRNIIYTDYISFLVGIKRHLFKKEHIEEVDRIKVQKLINEINNVFDVKFSQVDLGVNILNVMVRYKIMYSYYEKIIRKINPKIIIEVVSYSFSRFIVNDIAKRLGIPTIELQHGTMGKYHIAYNFAEKTAISTFPDYIFLFGKFWKDNTRLPIEDSKVKVVGWPYYEEKVNLKKNLKRDTNKKVILFISQGPIGKELSKLAVDTSRKINLERYRIIYKLHPGEYVRWKVEYPWLLESNIEIIDNNEKDMHHYFSQADIQVGVSSTALFEGLGYGLETYIYKIYSHEYMEDLYVNNLVDLVESVDDLLLYLANSMNHQVSYDITYFWEKNGIDNLIREINSIIYNTNLNIKVESHEGKHE